LKGGEIRSPLLKSKRIPLILRTRLLTNLNHDSRDSFDGGKWLKSNQSHNQKQNQNPKGKLKRQDQKRTLAPPLALSEDPSSSSLESESSSVSRARYKRCRKSKKKRECQMQGKSKPQERFTGSDPLVGENKRISGLSINGRDIDLTVGPPNVREKDSMELYCTVVDVTSLPDMFGSVWTVR
jgi:hypothetical protein